MNFLNKLLNLKKLKMKKLAFLAIVLFSILFAYPQAKLMVGADATFTAFQLGKPYQTNNFFNNPVAKSSNNVTLKNSISVNVVYALGFFYNMEYERLFAKRFGISATAGFYGAGVGLNVHLKPSIRSSYFTLRTLLQSPKDNPYYLVGGPAFVYRGKNWLSAQAGVFFTGGNQDKLKYPILISLGLGGYIPW